MVSRSKTNYTYRNGKYSEIQREEEKFFFFLFIIPLKSFIVKCSETREKNRCL